MSSAPALNVLKPQDFASNQDVKWCPGCGDYSVLSMMKKTCAKLGMDRSKLVIVSGIGCSSRFPYYVSSYGFHSIHGRAPTLASGLKLARPDLQVWVMTGDGDALSIGGNHFLHALRRNLDLKIVMFNNRIYGLTKGQYSPTSEQGKKVKSAPMGAPDKPVRPVSIAIAAEATFVARAIAVDVKSMEYALERAAIHQGSAFVEIYQNCNIFNDGAFDYASDKDVKADNTILLEHGKPMIFGKSREKGIRLRGLTPEIVKVADVKPEELLVHDEKTSDSSLAFMLSRFRYPEMPEPIGVFRAVSEPRYGDIVYGQIAEARKKLGDGDIQALLAGGETWRVG